jgi:glycosyltransferase involved in cell wall biosynthesis
VCFGDGPLLGDLQQRSSVPGSRPLAHILAFRSDAASWLAASDFFVLPSRWEGQPLVVLEAMAHSLSVVTLTERMDDLVVDGRNGRVVHSVGQLASVIEQWIRTPTSRPHDEEFNRQLGREHSLEVVTDSYESLYGTKI